MRLTKTTNLNSNLKSKNQRGAALVSTLLISAMLLTAGGMLILTTSMAGTNTIDAAAEMQAYYGAEAGIQATLNVLRGNVMPSPLFVANPAGTVAQQNRITFTRALQQATSNLAGDPAALSPRLSRWINYNYTPSGLGYADRVGISAGYNPFNGIAYSITVTDPDNTNLAIKVPLRLIINATGYGPRGSRKTLSMLVTSNSLQVEVPAALVLRGHDNGTTNINVELGNSGAKTYSGVDNAGLDATKPSVAVSEHDVATLQAAYASKPGSLADPKYRVLDLASDPYPGGVKPPWFLETADDARAFLVEAEALANSCAAPGSPCPKRGVVLSSLNGYAGSAASPQFTIVKGNCNLDGGAGLLIVTGTVTFDGPGPNFDGIILVLGEGRLVKTGGGNRDIFGSIMVARFGATGGFLEPTFDYGTGAGSSNLQFDSRAALNSVVLAGVKVLGIAEKP
ncbi:MAG TPA: hypothetical protein VJU86_12900 [Pyrinomonadaceae bacterium]|nr:hypothetical protein [Pyrinomonadaceae bacterium]